MKNSNFFQEEFCHDEDDEDGLPAAPETIPILFFGRQRDRILHFLRIAGTDFDVVVCLDGLACGTAWSSL